MTTMEILTKLESQCFIPLGKDQEMFFLGLSHSFTDNSTRLDIVPVTEPLEVSSEPWKLLEINLDLYKSLV